MNEKTLTSEALARNAPGRETVVELAYFVDRHGIGKLVAALRGAGLHFAGKTTQRMVASDIDVRDVDAMLIVYALVPALAMGCDHDPYFEYPFPDVHDRIDLPDPAEAETLLADPANEE